MIARTVAHAGDSIMLPAAHAKLTRADSSPAVLTQKSDAPATTATTATTADQSAKKTMQAVKNNPVKPLSETTAGHRAAKVVKTAEALSSVRPNPGSHRNDSNTKPSWGETLRAMYGSFGRESIAAFTASAIEHLVMANVAALNPLNSVITGLGAAAGAVSGAYTGLGLGSNMAAQYTNNRHLQYLGAGMGGLAGAALGAAPSLVEHVLYPGSHTQAHKQIGTLVDVTAHAIALHNLAKKGENIAWNDAPTFSGITSTGLAPSLLVNSAVGALKSQLPHVIADTVVGSIGLGLGNAGAGGNLARSFRSDTSIKKASSKPEALQVANHAMARGAVSTVMQGMGMGIKASGIAGAAGPAVAGIINALPALAYNYTPLIAEPTLEGIGRIINRKVDGIAPDITNTRARNEWISQIVASNESNGIESKTFKQISPV